MKKKDLTSKQISSVPCPTCGAAIGKRCVLHSGGPRSEPHVDRKFSATAAFERKWIYPGHRCWLTSGPAHSNSAFIEVPFLPIYFNFFSAGPGERYLFWKIPCPQLSALAAEG